MAEHKSRDRSSSTELQLKFPGCTHYRRRNDNHYRCQQCSLNEGLTLCTEDSPCEVCKDWLPEAWRKSSTRNANARQMLRRRRLRSPRRETLWMILSRYTHRKMPFNFHPPGVRVTGRPRRREQRQPQDLVLRLWRQILLAGLPGPVIRRRPCPPACPWWDSPGLTVFPGPRGQNAIGHRVGSAVDVLMGPTDATTHQGPIIHPDTTVDVERVGSGPGPHRQEGPAPAGRLTRRMLRGRAVSHRGRRMSGLQGLLLILIPIITRHRLIVGPCLLHHRWRR